MRAAIGVLVLLFAVSMAFIGGASIALFIRERLGKIGVLVGYAAILAYGWADWSQAREWPVWILIAAWSAGLAMPLLVSAQPTSGRR